MGVKIVKGIAGQLDSSTAAQRQSQQSSSSNTTGAALQGVVNASDAVITTLRSARAESSGEKLSLEKADKLAKDVGDRIREEKEEALGAIGDFSLTSVRDAFGV